MSVEGLAQGHLLRDVLGEVCNKVYSRGSSVSVLHADMGNSEVGHNALGETSGPCLFTKLSAEL